VSGPEPPDWALPSWDALPDDDPGRTGPARSPTPPERTAAGARSASPAAGPSGPSPVGGVAGGGVAGGGSPRPAILGVSELTHAIRDAVRADERLRDLWVEGEVGRVTVSSAGHAYFTLKDERSQLSCVWFRDDRISSPFEPRTGLRIVVRGRIDVFDQQGVYQLYVSTVQPAGFGDLALRFEELKARLSAEGLFDAARKRPLPARPAVIAVATSSTGAVWHDIRHVLERRWPLARVVFASCQVQGENAPPSVVAALERIARYAAQCASDGRPADAPVVTILARGGGSLEDLWSFNDERVVRAIVAHPLPVVCGVGHETDVTLADFAADLRAPTPSAAAELVVPDRATIAAGLSADARRLAGVAERTVAGARRELDAERRALDGLRPADRLAQARERAGVLLDRATRIVHERVGAARVADGRAVARLDPIALGRLGAARSALEAGAAALSVLGPQATLDRGYAIVRRADDGRILRRAEEAGAGTDLAIRLAAGELGATSTGPAKPEMTCDPG
jgi:exodeoxyribonuclease VII large subunit